MSKKQNDYLSNLLGPAAPLPSQDPSRDLGGPSGAATLLGRESALARVASGEVRQVTQLLLDPKRVRIWSGNPRHQDSLNEQNCRDLIDAILAENGQKVPAIVRRVTNDPEHEYEVIAGTRRHWAVSWLRVNNYPDMMFLAQVHALDDEAAFRISDIENRARKDVSDFERARTYLAALSLHYGGKQARMAERLRLTPGWLSKLLKVAALPDWIVAAFSSPGDITLTSCYPLAQKVDAILQERDKAAIDRLQAEAKALSEEQERHQSEGTQGVPAPEAVARLIRAAAEPSAEEPLVKFESASGRTALSVLSANRNGVSIRLHAGSGASQAELATMVKQALDELNRQGRGLRL